MGRNIWVLVSLLAVVTACGGSTDSGDVGSGNPGAGGSGQAGSGTAGAGTAGSGQAGSGTAGSGVAGTGVAGSGTAGSGQAGSGTGGVAGTGGFDPCAGKGCGEACDPCPPGSDCDTAGPTYCDAKGACGLGMPTCSGGPCKIDADCPQFDNGTQGYCVDGTCIYKPLFPCAGLPCGAPCDSCLPGQPCPDVETFCGVNGECTAALPQCGGECTSPKECPVPEGPCKQCPNGTLSCPEATCNGGVCGVQYPPCGDAECTSPADCPVDDGCAVCPDGSLSCPTATCTNGICGQVSPGCKAECSSPKECPSPKAPCQQCADGQLSCPVATCEGGVCGVAYDPPCGDVQCSSPKECPVPGVCQVCPDGSTSCAQPTCEGGKCGVYFPPCPDNLCAPAQVKSDPNCKKQLGYYWDGASCQPLNGCACFGECEKLVPTYDECVKIHSSCGGPDPQCKSDVDCPQPGGPCQICPDGSSACPTAQCIGGQCVLSMGTCKTDCAPDEAVGVGDCKKLLGFSWNGKDCTSLTGCECKGADCGLLTDYDTCIAAHKACLQPTSPCSGKKCGDFCSSCTGDICPPVVEFCNMKGDCTPEQPVCVFP